MSLYIIFFANMANNHFGKLFYKVRIWTTNGQLSFLQICVSVISFNLVMYPENMFTDYRDRQLICKLFKLFFADFCSEQILHPFVPHWLYLQIVVPNIFLQQVILVMWSGSGLSWWSRFTGSKPANHLEKLRCCSCGGPTWWK